MFRRARWTIPLLFGVLALASVATTAATEPSGSIDAPLDEADREMIEFERLREQVLAAFALVDDPPLARRDDPSLLWDSSDRLLALGTDVIPFLENEILGLDVNRFSVAGYTLGRFDTPEAEQILRDGIARFDGAESKMAQLKLRALVLDLAVQRQPDTLDVIAKLSTDVTAMEYLEGWTTLDIVAVLLAPGSRDTLLAWVPRLLSERSSANDRRLATTLEALARVPSPEVAAAAIGVLDESPYVRARRAAALALAAAETPQGVARLLALLRDPDEDPRVVGQAARAIETLLPADRFDEILAILESLEDPFARASLYRTIAAIDPERGLRALRSHRHRGGSQERSALVTAIARTGRSDGLNLMRAALADDDVTVAMAAVRALAAMASPAAIESLLANLNDPRWPVRQTTVEALAALGESRAGPRIATRLLGDELGQPRTSLSTRSRVRTYGEALVALGDTAALDDIKAKIDRQGDAGLIAYLRDLTARLETIRTHGNDVAAWSALLSGDDEAMRQLAIDRLTAIGGNAAVGALAARFEHAGSAERARILRALGRTADPGGLVVLADVLLSPRFDVGTGPDLRAWAAWAAWRVGTEDAETLLESSAKRRDGRDGEVLVRLALLRGRAEAKRIEGYRTARLEKPGRRAGPEQDRLDRLVRDLRDGRPLDAYEDEPDLDPADLASPAEDG